MTQDTTAIEGTDNRRVLIVDDTEAIHDDFRKIIGSSQSTDGLDTLEAELFGEVKKAVAFEIDSALQGDVGLERVRAARAEGRPYALAFVDVRMPPGPDGIVTTAKILEADPDVTVVICSAYSDHSWSEIAEVLGATDRVFILRKPFDAIEVRQLAHAAVRRWALVREASMQRDELEARVLRRTRQLEEANAKLVAEVAVREKIEIELRLAHKLEAVGQLAAGIAHEINTPMQYIGDNVHFLSSAFEDLMTLVAAYRDAMPPSVRGQLEEAEADADLEYIEAHVPRALEMTLSGINRVTEIVRSMKELSHPDQREKTAVDLNQALKNTLVVARNEYKYVANVETELADIPPVMCHGGDMGQVFLNIIVNAAHAIADVVRGTDKRGTITVGTRAEGTDHVVVEISDTGGGIPEAIRHRIFDPFFTTKEVGKGTGQGLAISRAVIDKHGGAIAVHTEPGRGTTFTITLPVSSETGEQEAA